MLYSILIYGFEERAASPPTEEVRETLERHAALRRDLAAKRTLGPVMRLAPLEAKTVRKYKDRRYVTDGPYAESKEQLMGIYVVDCATFDEAIAAVERLDFESGVFEIQPVTWFDPGVVSARIPQAE